MGRRVWAAGWVALTLAACSSTTNITNITGQDGGDVPDSGQVGLAPETGDGQTSTDAGVDHEQPLPDGALDSGALPDADAGQEMDSGDGGVDPGVDAGTCTGFVRYEIPAGSYAWGHRCTGFQLSTTVHEPPDQTDCQYVGYTLTNQCVKWGSDKTSLVIYFKQSSAAGQDCNIQIYPRLDGGDTHSCN